MSDETMVDRLARELARARTGGNVYMDGAHNPLPSEYVKARQFLEALESQNQALQEENVKLVQNAGVAAEVLDALRERAEKAEDLLRAVAFDDQHKLQVWLEPLYIREPYVKVLVDKATELLSPTQETDPE